MEVLALVLAIGLGFGLACFIFATLLAKSNDIGNSIGKVSHYSNGIYYDRNQNKLKNNEKETFGLGYFREDDQNRRPESAYDKLVEQVENPNIVSSRIDDSIRNLERR